jgi:hypothetical protein
VHALILPSQLPIDLRIQFRDLEEVFFVGRSTVYSGMPLTTIPQNDADGPDHMNILSSRGAQTQVCSFFFGADESHIGQLQTSSWTKSQLKDKSMLPLGLDESHVSE